MQHGLFQELMLYDYELDHNAMESTKKGSIYGSYRSVLLFIQDYYE